jgi:enamine deaminase RidA (YjgF/YER057c/UK114 family)
VRRISSGSSFEAEIGYCRVVDDGAYLHVSGCTGFDYASMTLADGVVAQAEQALRNIESALASTGASFADIVRVHYILPDRTDFPACFAKLRAWFGANPPAATMIVAGLMDPAMKIEIEVTARRPRVGHSGGRGGR